MINLARFARSLKGKRVEGSFAVSLKAKILLITSSSSLTATASNATTQKTCRPLTRSLPPDDAVSPLLLDALFVQNLPGSRQYMTENFFNKQMTRIVRTYAKQQTPSIKWSDFTMFEFSRNFDREYSFFLGSKLLFYL